MLKKNKKDQAKQGEQKVQIQQMVEIAKEDWLDSWPITALEGADDKVHMIAAYE